jgi:hypothetical protein
MLLANTAFDQISYLFDRIQVRRIAWPLQKRDTPGLEDGCVLTGFMWRSPILH